MLADPFPVRFGTFNFAGVRGMPASHRLLWGLIVTAPGRIANQGEAPDRSDRLGRNRP